MQSAHDQLVQALRGEFVDTGASDGRGAAKLVGSTSKHCVGPLLTLREATAAYAHLRAKAALKEGRPQVYVGISEGGLALSATLVPLPPRGASGHEAGLRRAGGDAGAR